MKANHPVSPTSLVDVRAGRGSAGGRRIAGVDLPEVSYPTDQSGLTNTWVRNLHGGGVAVMFLNAGLHDAQTVRVQALLVEDDGDALRCLLLIRAC